MVCEMMAAALRTEETFGDRLARARELGGLSARKLSALAGLASGHVTLIEHRRKTVEARTAIRLANALGVSPDWLIEGKGEPPTARQVKRALGRSRTAKANDGGPNHG